jgi:hypothetical protein
MKTKLTTAFLIGLVLGALLSPLRFQITPGLFAYKLDRLTGRSWSSMAGGPWQPVASN